MIRVTCLRGESGTFESQGAVFVFSQNSVLEFNYQTKLPLEMASQREKQQFQRDVEAEDEEIEHVKAEYQRKIRFFVQECLQGMCDFFV